MPGQAGPSMAFAEQSLRRRAAIVAAGALAIAGPYSAVYPRESPGGWNLVGSCEARLFDPSQDRPALLVAGAAVRLVLA